MAANARRSTSPTAFDVVATPVCIPRGSVPVQRAALLGLEAAFYHPSCTSRRPVAPDFSSAPFSFARLGHTATLGVTPPVLTRKRIFDRDLVASCQQSFHLVVSAMMMPATQSPVSPTATVSHVELVSFANGGIIAIYALRGPHTDPCHVLTMTGAAPVCHTMMTVPCTTDGSPTRTFSDGIETPLISRTGTDLVLVVGTAMGDVLMWSVTCEGQISRVNPSNGKGSPRLFESAVTAVVPFSDPRQKGAPLVFVGFDNGAAMVVQLDVSRLTVLSSAPALGTGILPRAHRLSRSVTAAALCPHLSASAAAVAFANGGVFVVDTRSLSVLGVYDHHIASFGSLLTMCWSPRGDALFIGGEDDVITCLIVNDSGAPVAGAEEGSGSQRFALSLAARRIYHRSWVSCLAVMPLAVPAPGHDYLLFSAGQDNVVTAWLVEDVRGMSPSAVPLLRTSSALHPAILAAALALSKTPPRDAGAAPTSQHPSPATTVSPSMQICVSTEPAAELRGLHGEKSIVASLLVTPVHGELVTGCCQGRLKHWVESPTDESDRCSAISN